MLGDRCRGDGPARRDFPDAARWDEALANVAVVEAAALRAANLDLLRRPGARFAEYFEPFSGEPLGSLDQSWTAAVALDWLPMPSG